MGVKIAGGSGTIEKSKSEWTAPYTIADFDFLTTFPDVADYGDAAGGVTTIETGFIRMVYPSDPLGSNVYCWLSLGGFDRTHVFLKFRARIPTVYKGAPKFVKFFGQQLEAGNKSNTTFGLTDDAEHYQVSFGDGSTVNNDVGHIIKLNGDDKDFAGRSWAIDAVIDTPQNDTYFYDEDWHDIEIELKFNSGTTAGNETNDGRYVLTIDDVNYVTAYNLYNRHWSNLPLLGVNLGDLCQYQTSTFTMEFTDIKYSTREFI